MKLDLVSDDPHTGLQPGRFNMSQAQNSCMQAASNAAGCARGISLQQQEVDTRVALPESLFGEADSAALEARMQLTCGICNFWAENRELLQVSACTKSCSGVLLSASTSRLHFVPVNTRVPSHQ